MPSAADRRPVETPGAVTVRVPAKVNLHLGVGARRPDGYHELVTVFLALSLVDDVSVAPAARFSVRVIGEGSAEVPLGPDNLALRAARALARATGVRDRAAIVIRKGIPVAGGMAGGSADAAAALVACDAMWGTALPRDDLAAIGGQLGSDVPFALSGGLALATGRGEVLAPVLGRGEYHWVLALADCGLPTPAVYARLDEQRSAAGGEPVVPAAADPVLAALRAGDAAALGAALRNDLQPAAMSLRPPLRQVLDTGRDLGALGSVVSGSGPTVAHLAADAAHARSLAAALAGAGVARAVRVASGPVPGARLLPPAA